MITPKTNPEKYWKLDHEGHSWHVPTYIWNKLSDTVGDAVREGYKTARPQELDGGEIVAAKYIAWQKEDSNYSRTVVKTVCVPINDAPILEGVLYDFLSNPEIDRIVNFMKPVTIGSASAPTAVTANETQTEVESASIPSA